IRRGSFPDLLFCFFLLVSILTTDFNTSISMKNYLTILFLFSICLSFGQVRESADPKVRPSAINTKTSHTPFSFIDTEFSLSKYTPPPLEQIRENWVTTAWKNETVHTQLAVAPNLPNGSEVAVTLHTSSLKNGKNSIAQENIQFTPITYVMTDHPSDLKRGCGIKITLDSSLVADRIEHSTSFAHLA